MSAQYAEMGPLTFGGCFTGEFGLGDGLPIEEAPFVIARDRIIEARHNPFDRKLLPVGIDPQTGGRTAGGYYLLPSFEDAQEMLRWYTDPVNGMIVDGTPMLEREYFEEPRAHCWQVLGAEDFAPLASAQHIVRFQRWSCRDPDLLQSLKKLWPQLRKEAVSQQLSALWLLCNPQQEESVGLISVSARSKSSDRQAPDLRGVEQLAAVRTIAQPISDICRSQVCFDRSSLVLSIWYQDAAGPQGSSIQFPNSPPFPGLQ